MSGLTDGEPQSVDESVSGRVSEWTSRSVDESVISAQRQSSVLADSLRSFYSPAAEPEFLALPTSSSKTAAASSPRRLLTAEVAAGALGNSRGKHLCAFCSSFSAGRAAGSPWLLPPWLVEAAAVQRPLCRGRSQLLLRFMLQPVSAPRRRWQEVGSAASRTGLSGLVWSLNFDTPSRSTSARVAARRRQQ